MSTETKITNEQFAAAVAAYTNNQADEEAQETLVDGVLQEGGVEYKGQHYRIFRAELELHQEEDVEDYPMGRLEHQRIVLFVDHRYEADEPSEFDFEDYLILLTSVLD
jgi:hypothetical protein